jgi:chromate reductase
LLRDMRSRLLLLNGSLRGAAGNTATLLQYAGTFLDGSWESDTLSLAEYEGSIESLVERLTAADAFLLGSGVYWGSWGSPLQRFLEVISAYELSSCFLGKPAGAVISADSVGGLDVAQRLLGAFSLLGCLVPPLSTVVVSRVATTARQIDPEANDDVWQADDLKVLVKNLSTASGSRALPWATWPVRKLARLAGAYPTHGPLNAGLAKFL